MTRDPSFGVSDTYAVQEREWLLKSVADLEDKVHRFSVDACKARASAVREIEEAERLRRELAHMTADCQRLGTLADQRLETILWLEEEVLR